MMQKTVCVDFDGVIHAYDSKWTDAVTISDGPVPGAFAWLEAAVKRFDVAIYSSRSQTPGAVEAMRAWFAAHGLRPEVLERLEFPTAKPAAFMTIDDRAFRFEGTFPSLDEIAAFVPWNKRPTIGVGDPMPAPSDGEGEPCVFCGKPIVHPSEATWLRQAVFAGVEAGRMRREPGKTIRHHRTCGVPLELYQTG
jgi:hypothetical protein